MSLDELKKKAEDLYGKMGVSVLYGTSDGQIFLRQNPAALHAQANKLELYTLENAPVEKKSKSKTTKKS